MAGFSTTGSQADMCPSYCLGFSEPERPVIGGRLLAGGGATGRNQFYLLRRRGTGDGRQCGFSLGLGLGSLDHLFLCLGISGLDGRLHLPLSAGVC